MQHDQILYDCLVVGAGPAGLSAALFLARYRRPVIAFHTNSPRNLYSHGVHGFLGHHGILPTDLLARGKEEVLQHGGIIHEARITEIKRVSEECFEAIAEEPDGSRQSYRGRTVLLATGLRDLTPDCPGFRDFYGASVHHCPDCDGYERRDQHLAVMGRGKRVTGFTLELLTWTNRITILSNGIGDELTDEQRQQLSSHGIKVLTEPVARLEGDVESKQLHRVVFRDGSALECDALFFTLGTIPASDLYVQLGCNLDEECGLVWVDEHQQTSVQGVYAAGDLTPHSQLAVVAAAEGAMAAIHIHKSLRPPDRLPAP